MGTWATPNTPAKAQRLAKLLMRPLSAERASDSLYDLVGDDGLFDEIAQAKRDGSRDVRVLVATTLEKWDKSYHREPDCWYDSFSPRTWEVLRGAYKKILKRRAEDRAWDRLRYPMRPSRARS